MDKTIENFANQAETYLGAVTTNHWINAVIIIAFALVGAWLADLFVVESIKRVMAKTKNKLDDEVVRMLHKPVFTTFAVMGLTLATHTLDDELGEPFVNMVVSILKSIVILTWVVFLMRSVGAILLTMQRNPAHFEFAQKDTVPLIRNVMIVLIALAGAYAILVAWDINVTGLVASAGIVGLALSFAAQDTLSHLFAGVAILADRPYKIGDYIVLDTGERGEVTAIGLRSTRLMTRDDVEVSIPNGVMGSAKIVNESGGTNTKYRIRAAVGVAYGSDVDQVLEVLEDIARSNPDLCTEPSPRARFRQFGASSLDFELLAWIAEPALRGLLVHELNREIYIRFKAENIAIPFPQQDVWVRQLPTESS